MNTFPVLATKKEFFDDLQSPGDFYLTRPQENFKPQGMYYVCPCGCDRKGYLPFRGGQFTTGLGPSWEFDGNEDKPTLSPSILDKSCGWHGYLKEGEFTRCE